MAAVRARFQAMGLDSNDRHVGCNGVMVVGKDLVRLARNAECPIDALGAR